MSEGSEPSYRICWSQRHQELRVSLAKQAAERGMAERFAQVVRTIVQRFETAPGNWGERRYDLQHMGLAMYHAILSPLHVQYAVDEARRFV